MSYHVFLVNKERAEKHLLVTFPTLTAAKTFCEHIDAETIIQREKKR